MFAVVAMGDLSLHDPAHYVTSVITGRDYRYSSMTPLKTWLYIDSTTLHTWKNSFIKFNVYLHFVWSEWNPATKSTDKKLTKIAFTIFKKMYLCTSRKMEPTVCDWTASFSL